MLKHKAGDIITYSVSSKSITVILSNFPSLSVASHSHGILSAGHNGCNGLNVDYIWTIFRFGEPVFTVNVTQCGAVGLQIHLDSRLTLSLLPSCREGGFVCFVLYLTTSLSVGMEAVVAVARWNLGEMC